MSHKSGLTGLAQPTAVEDYYDWDKITGLLAAQAPLFPPGSTTGYHAITYGFLVGEVIRRITGQTVGEFLASQVAGPAGADFVIGLPEGELGRCSELLGVRPSDDEQAALAQAYANADPAALSGPEGHYGPNPAAFGHDGFGGSMVGCDPEAGVAFAYVMNRMGMNLADDPRKMAVIDAVYQSR